MEIQIVSPYLYLCFSCHLLTNTISTVQWQLLLCSCRSSTLYATEHVAVQFPHCCYVNHMLCSAAANSTANIGIMGSSQGEFHIFYLMSRDRCTVLFSLLCYDVRMNLNVFIPQSALLLTQAAGCFMYLLLYLYISHDWFFPDPFQFISHPNIWPYTVWSKY